MAWQCDKCNHWTADKMIHTCINDKVDRIREMLDVEELEGEMSANEFQGGDFNAGASEILKRWIEFNREVLEILDEKRKSDR